MRLAGFVSNHVLESARPVIIT